MKRIIFVMILMMGCLSYMIAQSGTNVSLCVYMPKNTEIPDAALQFLENQLENIVTQNGTADLAVCNRFILTAKVDVLKKDIVVGPPQRISQTLSITLQVGDVVDNKLFSSTSLTAVGIGTNLTKSYIEAFKQIRKNDKQIADFLERAKEKVVKYYQQHCESIYVEAQGLAKRQQYDEAIYRLACVPDIGTDCYTRCQNAMIQIWQARTNSEGRRLLKLARTAWAQSQNETGAEEAANYLRQIEPSADCQEEVSNLINTIMTKIVQDEERAWQFQLRQYNDRVRQEREAARNEQEIRRMGIQAAKEVAIAFAQNQPKREYIIW